MEVGFTGTQWGMTSSQKREVKAFLRMLAPIAVHHGDCIGSDAEFHAIAIQLGVPVVIHPPSDPKKRAFCSGAVSTRPPYTYRKRNYHIVNDTRVLLATPRFDYEERRSGTWMTIRYARKVGRPTAIIYPDGDVQYERWVATWQ